MTTLPIGLLEPDPENVRQRPATAAEDAALTASMLAVGLLQPLGVYLVEKSEDGTADRYRIRVGHRRYQAALRLGWEEVECHIGPRPQSDGHRALQQASENMMRADMSAVDVWQAVLRMRNARMKAATIAVALNITEKRVRQLLAMGGIHPDLVAYIRASGDLPSERELAAICQVDHEAQLAAFLPQKPPEGSRYGIQWYQVAVRCRVPRIPMSRAMFPKKLYTGPVFRDLFAERAEAEAEDVEQFIRLQEQWLGGRRQEMLDLGYDCGEWEQDQYGSTRAPKGCEGHGQRIPKEHPPIRDRRHWCWAGRVLANGTAEEALWRRKAEASPEGKAKAAAARAADVAAVPMTFKGTVLVEQAKRKAVAGWLQNGMDHGAADLLAACLLVLEHRLGPAAPDLRRLLAESGALDVNSEGRDFKIREAAGHVLSWAIHEKNLVPLDLVEAIGAGFGVVPSALYTREDLDTLKKPALDLIRKSGRLLDHSTQKALKDAIMRQMGKDGVVELTPDTLPRLELLAKGLPPEPHEEPAGDEPGDEEGEGYEGYEEDEAA